VLLLLLLLVVLLLPSPPDREAADHGSLMPLLCRHDDVAPPLTSGVFVASSRASLPH